MELRGYERVNLAPGETRLVSFIITSKELSFIGRDLKPVIELGEFDAMIGPNSKEFQAARFTLC
jgi:beta-glucosidase